MFFYHFAMEDQLPGADPREAMRSITDFLQRMSVKAASSTEPWLSHWQEWFERAKSFSSVVFSCVSPFWNLFVLVCRFFGCGVKNPPDLFLWVQEGHNFQGPIHSHFIKIHVARFHGGSGYGIYWSAGVHWIALGSFPLRFRYFSHIVVEHQPFGDDDFP